MPWHYMIDCQLQLSDRLDPWRYQSDCEWVCAMIRVQVSLDTFLSVDIYYIRVCVDSYFYMYVCVCI